jgi:hypothetical protein
MPPVRQPLSYICGRLFGIKGIRIKCPADPLQQFMAVWMCSWDLLRVQSLTRNRRQTGGLISGSVILN